MKKSILIPKMLQELHGEHANRLSLVLTYLGSLIAGLLVLWGCRSLNLLWWKFILLAVVYFNVAGGVVANLSSSTNQYYQQHGRMRIPFLLMHVFHPAMLILIFPHNAIYFAAAGFYTIGAGLVMHFIRSAEQQQAIAGFAFLVGVIGSTFFPLPAPVLYSFAPMLMIKLLIGFSVQRPSLETVLEDRLDE